MTYTSAQTQLMAHAIQLARRGWYTTMPNPRVGCVLVKDGAVCAEGWHEKAGQEHAEAMALRKAGAAAKGATAYITLEPCNHHGRTAPCSKALIAAGVCEVFVAMQDPNPLVAGSGSATLQEAGIGVHPGLLGQEALALNPGYIKRMRNGRPRVTCKLAMSLDGKVAALPNATLDEVVPPEAIWKLAEMSPLAGSTVRNRSTYEEP